MSLIIVFGTAYLVLLVLAAIVRGRWRKGFHTVRGIGIVAAGLVLLQLIVFFTLDVTFHGIWVDRIPLVLLLLSPVALFALYRDCLRPLAKWLTGIASIYPVLASLTFVINPFLFFIVGMPLLPLEVPEVQFSDDRFDIRTVPGLIAPAWLELVEKNGLLESSWGTGEGYWAHGVYPQHGELLVDADTTKVFQFALGDSTFIWTFAPQ